MLKQNQSIHSKLVLVMVCSSTYTQLLQLIQDSSVRMTFAITCKAGAMYFVGHLHPQSNLQSRYVEEKSYSELCKNRVSSFIKDNILQWKNHSHDFTLTAKPPCSGFGTPMVPAPLLQFYREAQASALDHVVFCLALLTNSNLNLYVAFPGFSITPCCTPAPFEYSHTWPNPSSS